jgi:hypothetical protein
MTQKRPQRTSRQPGPEVTGAVIKRYRKRDRQHVYGLQMRAYGERHWIPLGTERDGWNDVRAADRRDEIASLIRRGAWRPPNTFELDPREKNPGFHEFASDWLKRYRRTVDQSTADTAEYMLSNHLLPYLHEYRINQIDTRCCPPTSSTSSNAMRRSDGPKKPASRCTMQPDARAAR